MPIAHAPLRNRPAAAGFTLIELIVVIVILGVLAAVALPRFTSLQGDARAAKTNALAGSLRSAVALSKSTAIVKGNSCSGASTVTMENQTINLVNCAPAATATGIVLAANLNAANDGITIAHATTPNVTTITVAPTNCNITYAESTAADAQPVITVTTTGC